ncbi:hypothetical protein LPB72_06895 [Hydrogenophaga crassostreae]|uniref:ADP-dependent (S)-NAD(P)H-hydrate dehydratase n=2 Tax=Hydrogenophaga crassostreae TaxID=1763535 RepID=A0A167II26_9BURK|nr:bifunctional ADP-dependent NAD(P)H-hydrate dehydratase/NAD(P)H-hydrate epimerase [Hydrogenophaga crassostreae]AOW15545.1 hypothetical protein LPB072_10480 [Hydrogenophaga crassostreae]OAD42789.1 hypothetical protein LPB72_06895 [Hydrogenophaga crassostreae]
MRRISFDQLEQLHSVQATRALERAATAQLPAHALMARAGQAIAQLSQALAPHARRIWVACGPGNNGGDGLVAATLLYKHARQHGLQTQICITFAGDPNALPADASHALREALTCGLQPSDDPPTNFDFAIDALLGIGTAREPEGTIAKHLELLRNALAPVLSVDVPSALLPDTGVLLGPLPGTTPNVRHTLSLLTLKPGLFTAQGRDAAGDIWFDGLGVNHQPAAQPSGDLLSAFGIETITTDRPHASHKGSHGEVLVMGGQGMKDSGSGMVGAAALAARAALRTGAGRVYLSLIGAPSSPTDFDPGQPELMFRSVNAACQGDLLERSVVVCGCGGGESIVLQLPSILSRARTLVLDADALNAIAADTQLQSLLTQRQTRAWTTIITPHPLEAARLLGTTTTQVMQDRLAAGTQLSERFGAICVLKGSGTVITAPGQPRYINGSGNGALATAGTGDVLAGMLGAALALASPCKLPLITTAQTVFHHGWLADQWVRQRGAQPLTADLLTR